MGKHKPTPVKGTTPRARSQSTKRIARTEEALALRLEGRTYDVIARTMRISKTTAFRYVVDALKAAAERSAGLADQLRELEAAKLDAAEGVVLRRLSAMAAAADALDAGEADPSMAADLAALRDGRQLRALVTSLVDVSSRRAALMGLDSPTRTEIVTDAGALKAATSLAEALTRGDGGVDA